ncbi:hypothetical protein QE374_001779 [Microbacterium sp. SORGH_AS428]|uniref:hypothetical protein n=1 Tax=Microbacterium sp. SORGH_AS_0428 TaxID=3041788 RepID=UPI0028549945|nr:hypothetical protein [Microbacterium sp. SORGH_AS_0428]MDR6199870.1 hypothetical protein [Microbacterium sp. SORGH_AS_0428]
MRKLAPLALSAIALLALAGCAGGGNGGGDAAASSQSVQEACSIAQDKLTDAQSKLTDSLSAAASGDSEATTDLFNTVQKGLDDALAEVTNPDVKKPLQAVSDEYKTIGSSMQALADAGSDPAKMEELTKINDDVQASSERLKTASDELSKLCS